MSGLPKQIIEVPAADGLEQKTAPQRLAPGKSAKAINLQKNKQGRLEKRLGFVPLSNVDPFGSGYTPSAGLGLSTWNGGAKDTLLILGRGNRPSTTAIASSIQAYSDDLNGPLLKGPVPEFNVVSDTVTGGNLGAVSNPMCAVIGDYMMSAWIEIQTPLQIPPQSCGGALVWTVTQISTGQTVVAPTPVDSTTLTGSGITCARLEAVGSTFIIAYSRYIPSNPDLNIYFRTMTLSALTAGSGWSPGQGASPSVLVNNSTGFNGAFDLKVGDPGHFVLVYEGGSYNFSSGGFIFTGIYCNVYAISPFAMTSSLTVLASPGYQATAFGCRTNTATNHIAVCYALPNATYSYQVYAAIASGFPGTLSLYNNPTAIYMPSAANETPPFFLDVSLCPGGYGGRENFVESHSPGGAVWNACNLPVTAAGVGGKGATATCNLTGSVAQLGPNPFTVNDIVNGGIYGSTRGGTPVGMQVTDANGQVGLTWGMSNLGYALQLYDNASFTSIIGADQPTGQTPYTGTTASLSAPSASGFITATNLSGIVSTQAGFPITISGGASAHAGTFTISTVVSATSVTYYDPIGTADAGGTVHWSVPNPNTGPSNLIYPLKAVFSGGGGVILPASTTVTMNGGVGTLQYKITNPGIGYNPSVAPTVTISSADGAGSGATATASVNANGQLTSIVGTAPGSGYDVPPNVTVAYSTATVTSMTQSTQCRLIGLTNSTIHSENNARIIQNMFFVTGSSGQPVSRYNPTDGFGYCCGDATAPGTGSYQTHACSCITPGLTLASRGLEANGIVYYLGWIPSLTSGSFVILAFDLAQNPITTGGGVLIGNGYPMRPVGLLQTRSALADPGGGLQTVSANFGRNSTTGPNMWTGGSSWFLGTDNYATAYVSYVSSSFSNRLSYATGSIQTAPTQGPRTATWGNLTAIGGSLQTFYDGANDFEQGFLWSPDGVICTATLGTRVAGWSQGNFLDFSSPTDSYTWIFTWEQFDAQDNLHISARSVPVTISGQNLIDALGVSPAALAQGVTYSFTFYVPTLGATMRQWPILNQGLGPPGNDLRSYCIPPNGLSLGVYRTQKNQPVFYRIYDRGFNSTDTGGDSFTLPPLVTNTFVSTWNSTANANTVGVVQVTDSLNDTVITRINAGSALPFPLLYTDGTNGNPGSLDNYCPPPSSIVCRHKERLFIADGNLVMFTKSRGEQLVSGYNQTVNSIYVGGDDPITGLASMDDKLIVFKQNQLYYISGEGPGDDGSGSGFQEPQPIPTDAGCIWPGSVIPTPDGVYFMSNAGLRLVNRSDTVEYVGGPVEDELALYPVVTGAALYPSNNKIIFLANQNDTGSPLTGEILVKDYALNAWTTTQFFNFPRGFISTAVAYTNGTSGYWNTAPGLAWHVLGSNGILYRERNPNDIKAYWDTAVVGGASVYVSWTWLPAPIHLQDLGRFRSYDVQVWGASKSPHGLIVSSGIDYGTPGVPRTYPWSEIAPSGSPPQPLSQIVYYDGRMGEAFQFQVQDISDASSTDGQGFQVLGLSVTTGAYPGQYKVPPGSKQ